MVMYPSIPIGKEHGIQLFFTSFTETYGSMD